MFKQITKVLLVALFAAGCNGEILLQPGDVVSVDSAFSPEESEAVLRGLAEWNEALPALELRPTVSQDEVFGWTIRSARFNDGDRGKCSSHQPVIRIDVAQIYAEGLDVSVVTSVTLHELGHALGLYRDGSHAAEGVMQASSAGHTCIDIVTLVTACTARPELCDGRESATCVTAKHTTP